MTRTKAPDGCLDLGQIEARYETAREAPNWQDPNLLIEALTSSMYDVPELVAEVRRLRAAVDAVYQIGESHYYRKGPAPANCECLTCRLKHALDDTLDPKEQTA